MVPATIPARSFSSVIPHFRLSSSALPETVHVVPQKPRNTPEAPNDVISIRLTRQQHDALKALAARENRTVSQQVRHLVDTALGHPEPARAGA